MQSRSWAYLGVCAALAVGAGEPVATQVRVGQAEWQTVEPASDVVASMLDGASGEEDDGCERRAPEAAKGLAGSPAPA